MSEHSIVIDKGYDAPHDWTAVCGGCGWSGTATGSELLARAQYADHLRPAVSAPSPDTDEGRKLLRRALSYVEQVGLAVGANDPLLRQRDGLIRGLSAALAASTGDTTAPSDVKDATGECAVCEAPIWRNAATCWNCGGGAIVAIPASSTETDGSGT